MPGYAGFPYAAKLDNGQVRRTRVVDAPNYYGGPTIADQVRCYGRPSVIFHRKAWQYKTRMAVICSSVMCVHLNL